MSKKEMYLKALNNAGDLMVFEDYLIHSDYSLAEIRAIFELIKDKIDDCMEFGMYVRCGLLKCYQH